MADHLETTHDQMLSELRALIVVCSRSATSAADVSALAALVTAYIGAVEARPPSVQVAA